jgi:hypothetical protein
MKDELITFKTAKLAKEKGFPIIWKNIAYTPFYYCDENGKVWDSYLRRSEYDKKSEEVILYFKSTQSLLQRWLREVHGIHINITWRSLNNPLFGCELNQLYSKADFDSYHLGIYVDNKYKSYEKALEQGLQEALKLI